MNCERIRGQAGLALGGFLLVLMSTLGPAFSISLLASPTGLAGGHAGGFL